MLTIGTPSKPAGRGQRAACRRDWAGRERSSVTPRSADLVALVEVSQLTWIGGTRPWSTAAQMCGWISLSSVRSWRTAMPVGVGEGLRRRPCRATSTQTPPQARTMISAGLSWARAGLRQTQGVPTAVAAECRGLQQAAAADDRQVLGHSRCPPVLGSFSRGKAADGPMTSRRSRDRPARAGRGRPDRGRRAQTRVAECCDTRPRRAMRSPSKMVSVTMAGKLVVGGWLRLARQPSFSARKAAATVGSSGDTCRRRFELDRRRSARRSDRRAARRPSHRGSW